MCQDSSTTGTTWNVVATISTAAIESAPASTGTARSNIDAPAP